MSRRVPVWLVVAVVVIIGAGGAVAVAVSGGGGDDGPTTIGEDTSWHSIASTAAGQTVRLWMWGGEAALNSYIDDVVVPEAATAGVTLERVPIDDTASALARLIAEADAGSGEGAIDLLWVNGKNFSQGSDAGLWLSNWVSLLPNAALLDPDDATLWTDFGVPTQGEEMPWSRAAFVFAYDSERLADPPRSFDELLAYAHEHPGRIAYPAPPDFTGSAFVRQAVQALGEDEAFELLAELDPLLWREGRTYPKDQPELEQLFANGEIDLAMSYNPNFVDVAVARGVFADTVRPYVFDGGTLQNVSFLAIPSTAPSREGALVVANMMLSPQLQAAKLDRVGIPAVLAADQLPPASQPRSPLRLVDFGTPLRELPADEVPLLDRRWLQEVSS